jgi:DNA-binding NarL/FixJ family response regulator
MAEIRVLLVDDHAILREGVRALLGFYEDILVVGEAQDGSEALEKVASLMPDVVVMDLAMQGMNGQEATRCICERFPGVRVLILTQHEDRQYVLPLLKAGAAGYLLKRAVGSDLITAIRAVHSGGTYLHPSVSTILLEEVRGSGCRDWKDPDALTERESEVLHYIVQGLTNSQIALTLSLSVKTVEWHRTNLMNKLGQHNVADLVRYALQKGLVEGSAWLEPR